MQIQDINDYYRPKRFPWLPVALIAFAAISGGMFFFANKSSDKVPDGTSAIESTETDISEGAADDNKTATTSSGSTPAKSPAAAGASSSVQAESTKLLTPAEIEDSLSQCRKFEIAGNLEAARDRYLAILNRTPGNVRPQIESAIGKLSIDLLTTPRPMKGKIEYVIKSGDTISSIASRHNCPVLLIQKANNISDSARLQIGDRLVFPDHPKFTVLISKSENTLTLLLDDQFFKKYSVGTGMHAKTPAGTFRIFDKIAQPPWWPGDGRPAIPFGDPQNILGTHWLAIEATGETPRLRGYGIHGTWDESTLGKQSSAGCVRMKNSDVAEVFMMLPRGTPVKIVE